MPWTRATLVLTLLAIDPKGLGGAVVRARHGSVRDSFIEAAGILEQPLIKLHPAMDDEVLFGGIDLTETLTSGTLKRRKGLLGREGTAILTMAERCDPTLAARIAMALDDGSLSCLLALDEGAMEDECAPLSLTERLGFHIDLEMSHREVGLLPDHEEVTQAQKYFDDVRVSDEIFGTLISICEQLGIVSLRAPLFALRAARAHAALNGQKEVRTANIEVAAALCLAHRATRLPAPQEPHEDDAQQPDQPDEAADADSSTSEVQTLDDRILEAIFASLPDGLLDQIKPKRFRGRGSGAGAKSRSNRRGRPKPARAGRLSGRNRLDLIATLRAAAPWQRLRGAPLGQVSVTTADFRIRQYEQKSDRLLIFAVDASGSAAIARLAEAKGAVELLLADAYSRRDHVCLISFRGDTAETLLPPTRSLVQTKKRLAALPGGGGTPLAAGLLEGLQTALRAKSNGMTPCLILLTDGRANVALDGTANRKMAGEDADRIAKQIHATGTETIVLDLGKRPATYLAELASKMNGHYTALPRADANMVSHAVTTALGE